MKLNDFKMIKHTINAPDWRTTQSIHALQLVYQDQVIDLTYLDSGNNAEYDLSTIVSFNTESDLITDDLMEFIEENILDLLDLSEVSND